MAKEKFFDHPSFVMFQIEQNWGGGTKAWIYFKIRLSDFSTEELKGIAKKEMQLDWEKTKKFPSWTAPEPCRPTVNVSEYKDGKKVKGGIQFKVKWR